MVGVIQVAQELIILMLLRDMVEVVVADQLLYEQMVVQVLVVMVVLEQDIQ